LSMYDRFGREIDYLRISVTDRCGLNCRYCKNEDFRLLDKDELLTDDELIRTASVMAGLGIKHIRLTGGEPLDREGITELTGRLVNTKGIISVDMTTNGLKLAQCASALAAAGLNGVNVSLDTVDESRFRMICGDREGASDSGYVSRILDGIDAALEAGLKVKINTVFTRINRDDWESMALLAKERSVDVRFIELMPLGAWQPADHVPVSWLKEQLITAFPKAQKLDGRRGSGPAVYYRIPGFKGCIGFISAVGDKFCDRCNRIRLTAEGGLKPCLCLGDKLDLKGMLRNDRSDQELSEAIKRAIYEKPREHCFETPELVTEHMSMSAIGG